jgi:hypothetical protein
MSDVAWPLAVFGSVAIAAWVASLWLRLRAEADKARAERDERERGLSAVVEAIRKETHDACTKMNTFIANNRRG